MARSIAETAQVTGPWQASYTPALSVARGERLTAGAADPDNPGWRWCVNAAGLGGWLPEDWVVGECARGDFDTTELTVAEGERLALLRSQAGWCLCRLEDGREGWLPESVLSIRG